MYFCSGEPMHFCSGVDSISAANAKAAARMVGSIQSIVMNPP
jgi:hypothetical protein